MNRKELEEHIAYVLTADRPDIKDIMSAIDEYAAEEYELGFRRGKEEYKRSGTERTTSNAKADNRYA